MIEVRELIKEYGNKRAVNRLSFTAHAGVVTGLLGPRGSGKSTIMRIILGLEASTSGIALVNGQRVAAIDRTMRGRRRVTEVLDEVELSAVAGKQISGFSVGMRQRLGITGALLGDPGVLVLDEPFDGLDSEGSIRWIRDLTRSLAAQGRTVLVSSRHMSGMARIADQLLITAGGELIAETSTRELTERSQRDVFVRSPRRSGLTKVLTSMGATVLAEPGGGLSVTGMDAWRIAAAAAEHDIPIQELTPRIASLEDYYAKLTSANGEYRVQP
ncbi:MAG: ATP-binding cassette domain-containing protein [Actinobacteria bacterium]|nr:ATP-binding cassette domain-containing protein [Actinomycetota bacterium]